MRVNKKYNPNEIFQYPIWVYIVCSIMLIAFVLGVNQCYITFLNKKHPKDILQTKSK